MYDFGPAVTESLHLPFLFHPMDDLTAMRGHLRGDRVGTDLSSLGLPSELENQILDILNLTSSVAGRLTGMIERDHQA